MPSESKGQDLSFEIESGALWFGNNDVRIPNNGGTKFDMLNLIGTDAVLYLRFRLNAQFGDRHTLRLLVAPVRKIGSGIFEEPVFFEETDFDADVVTDGLYRFNTYRLTYRYTFYDENRWTLGGGAAALVRDAKVELTQPDRTDSNTDLGFVPLLHVYAEGRFADRYAMKLDVETLASTQGRATDAALTMNYRLSDNWFLFGGYRVLEGGADVDEVFNFAWINFALVGLEISL